MELVNFLLKCGDDVRLWVGRRLRSQCEQQWGPLCRTFGSTCPLGNQSDDVQNAATTLPTTAALPITTQGRSQRQPTTAAKAEEKRSAQGAAAATSGLPAFEKANMTVA